MNSLFTSGPRAVLRATLKSYIDHWGARIADPDGLLANCLEDVREEELADADGAVHKTVVLAQRLLAARGYPVAAWERNKLRIVWSRNDRRHLVPNLR